MEAEFYRFSTLHSWYKHIPLEGHDYYVSKKSDFNDSQWHFSPYKPSGCESFCVRLGPFLRGIEGYYGGEPLWRGFHIIVEKAGESVFRQWIKTNYPHFSHIGWSHPHIEWTHLSVIEELYLTEWNRYLKALKEGYETFKINRNNESV
jgi:hypothetical protein